MTSRENPQAALAAIAQRCAENGKVQWKNGRTGFIAICPCHPDKNPSLDVDLKGGKVLVICRAGCAQADVAEALGLTGGRDRTFDPESLKREGRDPDTVDIYTNIHGQTVRACRWHIPLSLAGSRLLDIRSGKTRAIPLEDALRRYGMES